MPRARTFQEIGRLGSAVHVTLQFRRVQLAARDAVEVLLHAKHGQGCKQREFASEGFGARRHIGSVLGNPVKHQRVLQRGCLQRVGSHQQTSRQRQAKPARQPLEPSPVEVQAQPSGGNAHLGAGAAHPEVGGKRQIHRPAVGSALQLNHCQRSTAFKGIGQRFKPSRPLGTAGADLAKVEAAAKVPPLPAKQQDANSLLRVHTCQQVLKDRQITEGQPVGHGGPAQCQGGHRALDVQVGLIARTG